MAMLVDCQRRQRSQTSVLEEMVLELERLVLCSVELRFQPFAGDVGLGQGWPER
jgi:hypothetical protein